MKRFPPRQIRSEAGIGIVELLVATAVSLVLLGGMYVVFASSTTTHAYTERLSRLQENGRFAMYTLRREVRGTGYLGCWQDVKSFTNTLKNPNNFDTRFAEAVFGLNASGAGSWSDNEGKTYSAGQLDTQFRIPGALSGSDVLVLRGIDGQVRFSIEGHNPNSATLKISATTDSIQPGNILLISDCRHASVFQVTQFNDKSNTIVHGPGGNLFPGNSTTNLGNTYSGTAEIFQLRMSVFYLGTNDSGRPALFRRIITSTAADPEELIEGVENMQIRYGVDTDGDLAADAYVTAAAVADWQNVVSVRIGLLMRSEVVPRLQPQTPLPEYDVDGDGVPDFTDPGDGRLRLVMSGTVGLRNRLR